MEPQHTCSASKSTFIEHTQRLAALATSPKCLFAAYLTRYRISLALHTLGVLNEIIQIPTKSLALVGFRQCVID